MIRPPIIVDADGDLLVFPSLAEAEASLEPLAVQHGHYRAAYDREGRLLRVRVRIEQHRLLGLFRRTEERTELVETEHIATHDEALRALLLRFIQPSAIVRAGGVADPLEGLIRVAGGRHS